MDGVKLSFEAFIRFCESNDQHTVLWTLFDEYHQPTRSEALKPLLELFWGAMHGMLDGRNLFRSLRYTKKRLKHLRIDTQECTALFSNQGVPRVVCSFANYSTIS